MEAKKNMVAGLWKFDKEYVSRTEVENLANEWAQNEKYTELYVRGGGGNQTALGFVYIEDSDVSKTSDLDKKYFRKTYDDLLRKFGIGVKGYDISSEVTVIKGLHY